jgi:hypothetical protein
MYQSRDVCCGRSSWTDSSNSASTMASAGRPPLAGAVGGFDGHGDSLDGPIVRAFGQHLEAGRGRRYLKRPRQAVHGVGAVIDRDLGHDLEFAGRAVIGEAAHDPGFLRPQPDQQQQRQQGDAGRDGQPPGAALAEAHLGGGRVGLRRRGRLGRPGRRRLGHRRLG